MIEFRRFGNAGYAQLSETCPESIRRGGENGAEMGAFNRVIDAIRRDACSQALKYGTSVFASSLIQMFLGNSSGYAAPCRRDRGWIGICMRSCLGFSTQTQGATGLLAG